MSYQTEQMAHEIGTLDAELTEAHLYIDKLQNALAESVALQSHYAGLLNTYDGGQRLIFADVKAWLDRLEALDKEKS